MKKKKRKKRKKEHVYCKNMYFVHHIYIYIYIYIYTFHFTSGILYNYETIIDKIQRLKKIEPLFFSLVNKLYLSFS